MLERNFLLIRSVLYYWKGLTDDLKKKKKRFIIHKFFCIFIIVSFRQKKRPDFQPGLLLPQCITVCNPTDGL